MRQAKKDWTTQDAIALMTVTLNQELWKAVSAVILP